MAWPAVNDKDLVSGLYKALALYQQNSVFTLGQNVVYDSAPVCNSNLTAAIAANQNVPCKAPKLLPTAYQTKFP